MTTFNSVLTCIRFNLRSILTGFENLRLIFSCLFDQIFIGQVCLYTQRNLKFMPFALLTVRILFLSVQNSTDTFDSALIFSLISQSSSTGPKLVF